MFKASQLNASDYMRNRAFVTSDFRAAVLAMVLNKISNSHIGLF